MTGARILRWMLLAAASILFLCSLLVWLSAPTAWLWIVALVATEWGHFVALAALALAVIAWRARSMPAAILALLAAANFLSPVVRAALLARTLPARCASAFGVAAHQQPLSTARLVTGMPRDAIEVTELTYATNGSKPLKLDLYQAVDASELQPLVMVVHGGSWNAGNKEQLTDFNRHLAAQHYAVAAINYRHAPKHPFPAAVDDVFRAIEFLEHHAAEARIDISRVVLIGRSAGGQIALSAAYAGRLPAVRGVVSLYGPGDLVLGYENPSRRWVLDSKKVLAAYLGGSPTEVPAAYAAASPINFVGAETPPTLLIHGSLDPMVWPQQSEVLAARLQQAGRPYLYLSLPWATHGCEVNLSGPSGQLSAYAIDSFLAAAFR